MRRRGWALLVAAPVIAFGCGDRRKPLPVRGDFGPAVVVVDAPKPTVQAAPQLPLVDEKEPDDDLAHAQPIEAGKGIKGTLGPPSVIPGSKPPRQKSDEDVYSWVAPGVAAPDGGVAPQVARIDLGASKGVDLVLEVLDGDGKKLLTVNDGAEGQPETYPNLGVEPGHTYYFKVRGVKPFSTTEPYTLTVVSAPAVAGEEREPNDELARATALPAVGDVSGFYGRRRDEDFLTLPWTEQGAAPGSTLKLELSAVEGVAPEVRLQLGTQVVALARGGRGEELRMRNVGVPVDAKAAVPVGPIAVVVRAAEGRSVDARWVLRMQVEAPLDGAEREPNDSVAKATPIDAASGSGQASGFLWPGDQDVYVVSGVPDGSLVAASVEGVRGVDLKLERLGPDGKPLKKADDAGADKGEALPPTAPVGGAALFRVSGRARDTAFDAPYTLSVTVAPPAASDEREPNDSAASATPWPAGTEQVRGTLLPRGDEDWYRVVTPDGVAKATATLDGPPGVSAELRLVDENKIPLGPAQGRGKAAGPVSPGKVFFVVVKAPEKQSARDPYTLSLKLE